MKRLPIKIDLPEGFLDADMRCNYEVPPKLKRIWAVELDLLSELTRVCRKYGLRFHGAYGTMIGAVRHKGFIPWDDDMDVWMPRQDYEKLAEVAPKEFSHPYFLQTQQSDDRHYNPFNRLRNSETTAAIKGISGIDYNSGIYIDIFPLDRPFSGPFQDRLQKLLLAICQVGMRLNRGDNEGRRVISRLLAPVLMCGARTLSYQVWCRIYRKVLMMGAGDPNYLSPMFTRSPKPRYQKIAVSEFDDVIYVPFEFLEIPIPRSYDSILREYYGNYMEFPPVEERGKWHEGVVTFDPDVSYIDWFSKNARE